MSGPAPDADGADQLFYEDVAIGDNLPHRTVLAAPVQLFFFSAATYNGHRIHYDQRWATEVEGYPDLVVQGPLQVALLVRMLTDWIGGQGRVVNLAVQNRNIAYAGNELHFHGTVVSIREERDAGLVDLRIHCETNGQVLVPGTATVSLPRRLS
jgi:hydroxyacyl-ACP dehydratase HTD2-like protein with hotdog domain